MIVSDSSGTMITGAEDISAYRLLALKAALRIECCGMKASRGVNAAAMVRTTIGSKTKDKKALLGEYIAWLKERGLLAP